VVEAARTTLVIGDTGPCTSFIAEGSTSQTPELHSRRLPEITIGARPGGCLRIVRFPYTAMTSDLVKIIASDNGCAILTEPQNPVRNPRYLAPGDALLAVIRTG
jgi:hypothetical protein